MVNNSKRNMKKNEEQGQTKEKEGKERNTQSQEKERRQRISEEGKSKWEKMKKRENKENKNKEQEKQNFTGNKQQEKKAWWKWKRTQNQMKVNKKERETKKSKKVWRRKVEETIHHCWTSCWCSRQALQRALCWINQTRLWCFWAARYQGRETRAEPQVEAVRQPMIRSAYWSVVLPQQGRGNQVDITFMHTHTLK